MRAAEARAQNRELALEQAKWRYAGDRQRGHQEDGSANRHGMDETSLGAAKQIGLQMLLHVPRAEEQQRLGNGMKSKVQEHSKRSQRSAKGQGQDHDATVIDAGVRQKPPETFLDKYKRNSDANRQEAENDEQL